jgi:hypothetical protein
MKSGANTKENALFLLSACKRALQRLVDQSFQIDKIGLTKFLAGVTRRRCRQGLPETDPRSGTGKRLSGNRSGTIPE